MVLGRPAPFLAPPLVFLLGVSWMLFILFVFLQCSLKSMGGGAFAPSPLRLELFALSALSQSELKYEI